MANGITQLNRMRKQISPKLFRYRPLAHGDIKSSINTSPLFADLIIKEWIIRNIYL